LPVDFANKNVTARGNAFGWQAAHRLHERMSNLPDACSCLHVVAASLFS
jgi:hypothetical protein